MTKKCYIYQVPKYLSKEIAFTVFMCVCAFVHSPVLSTSTEHLLCDKKEPEKTDESKVDWHWQCNIYKVTAETLNPARRLSVMKL